jgi:hypothetical protein
VKSHLRAELTVRANYNQKEDSMKLSKALSAGVVAIALFVAVSAGAKSKDYKSVLLHYDATVAGSHLASGDYNIEWNTHTVSFLHGSKVVATVEGKIVDRGTRYGANQVVYGADANGARSIQEIRFQGSSEVIEFN